jgi:protein SCO1
MGQEPSRRAVSPMVWVGLGITLAVLLLALLLTVLKVRSAAPAPALPVLGAVAPFTLTNQENHLVTQADLFGEVWIADIIFTRCAGPCLRMSQQMKKLHSELGAQTKVKLVSLTTDPEFDTPEVLKKYGARFDADPNRWTFLTGTKGQIADLAIGSLKLTAIEKRPEEKENPDDLFIHSTIFVVVDKKLRLRGVFETEGEGISTEEARKRILEAVKKLGKEG